MTRTIRRGWRIAASGMAAAATAAIVISGASAPAHAATAQIAKIRQVACRSWTFNVYYGATGRRCYAGAGGELVRIPDVRRITTGTNSGIFVVRISAKGYLTFHFLPRESLVFPVREHAELIAIDIA